MSPQESADRAQPAFSPRSLLFVPAHRPEMIRKAVVSGADVVVVDLEDAVPEAERPRARWIAAETLSDSEPAPGTTVFVRVNARATDSFAADLEAVGQMAVAGLVLPKFESASDVAAVAQGLAATRPARRLIVGIETARGVADCRDLLDDAVDAAYFGAEDFIADVGGRRSEGNTEVLYARSQVVLSARLAGISVIDQAVLAYADDERFRADAHEGREIGYTGKICIHPRQVALAHEVFTPAESEIAHAEAVIQAAQAGAARLDGTMVDAVHVRMAQAVLHRRRAESGGGSE